MNGNGKIRLIILLEVIKRRWIEGGNPSMLYVMVKKNTKRSKWEWCDRNVNNNSSCWDNSLFCLKLHNGNVKTSTRNIGGKHKGHNKFRALANNVSGNVGSIEFLILLPIILFVIFGSIDYYVTQMQYNHLEKIKNYYVDRMKIEGTLSNDAYNELNTLLNDNFHDYEIVVSNSGDNIAYRNIEEPSEAKMFLEIKASPKFKPFVFGRLLGIKEDDSFFFVLKGETLSEKPYFN